MSPEHKEGILLPFFSNLSTFSYDRARDLLEREREKVKGTVSRWTHFISVLIQLCNAEKQYVNLSFLQARGFLRKDVSLKSSYENIGLETERLSDCNEASETEDVVTQVASDLATLVKGRLKAMDVYEKLSSSSKLPNYKELQPVVRSIAVRKKDIQAECLEPWKQVFYLEVGLLVDCISMCANLSSWDFYGSLTFLQSLTEKLNLWAEVIQNRETRKLSFATSLLRGVSGQSEPHLYTWFGKFRAALLSKFSIYYYQVLAKQSSGGEMRTLTSKLPVDHANRLISFHRRTDAAYVCVVFDANGLSGYKGPGYHVQVDKKESSPPTGLDLFPSVFSHPSHPTQHWPNIVMILADKEYERVLDRTLYFYDAGICLTTYLQMIEPRYTIVAMFEGRRPERDPNINSFLQETAAQLRLTKLLWGLKPGSK